MSSPMELRPGETAVNAPGDFNAGIYFIGRIRTPWTRRAECPRQGRLDGPVCRIELFEPWAAALDGLAAYERIEVLYWLHLSPRTIIRQSPRNDGVAQGAFSLRTPLRPNPIGTQMAALVGIDGPVLHVRGLDCVDGTPLLDLKPDRCAYTPLAAPQPGDSHAGDS
ncbi:tRNA (N6-threonylcarbamoyladenosine(37)-N6)-methyltransferase TrmO [Indioceanicola profundi]|uniref:tRNA (N6-threonylcarbamoyladenosine(37)-N6)-methyltransferase TrmO n=1 Tax=Indioceanicola profundi TaxID=2220096 RepID=UPI001CED9445|nr:tRNA (N6-threonylcarbamoyladenosine(37)-N6)-methyltransferase TrmO [Indioceanicola profundi]